MKGGGDVYSSLDVLFQEEYDVGTGCFKIFFIIATKVSRNFFFISICWRLYKIVGGI